MDKRDLRRRTWDALRSAGAARFPGAVGRIPNFTGAEAAAERLARTDAWRRAAAVKCNPDLPQRPLRHRALLEGKRVYVAVPKLAEAEPFVILDPEELERGELWHASSIRGAFELGLPLPLDGLEPLGLVVLGCVAVSRDGSRLGKGGGYADLEYALLREAGCVTARTPVATTAHPSQVVRRGTIPMERHDVPVDLFATPERCQRCERAHRRPSRVLWSQLSQERLEAIPVLAALRRQPPARSSPTARPRRPAQGR